MTGFGVWSVLAACLQLIVPSYAWRLVRRFGSQRVGWFITIAFSSLALLYMLRPAGVAGLATRYEIVFVVASLLLLIGMGHVETLCSLTQSSEKEAERRRSEAQAAVKGQTAELAHANEVLRQEIAERDQRERMLKESEAQYRFLFAENPQPMWIFDLRSHRFLAVNQAALRHYGYTREEFMALKPTELL